MKNPEKARKAILNLPIYLPIKPTKLKLFTQRGACFFPILSHSRFTFKAQITSPYMHPIGYTFKLNDVFTSIASKPRPPCQYWLDSGAKTFSLQMNILCQSTYGLKTDEKDHSCLSVSQKASHQMT